MPRLLRQPETTYEGGISVYGMLPLRLKSDQAAQSINVSSHAYSQNESLAMTTPMLKDSVAFGIGSVPEVKAVFTLQRDRMFYVWAVVSQSTPEVRKRIYAKEKEIIDLFLDFDFDFNIIADHGQNPDSVVTDPSVKLAYIRRQ